MIPLTTPPNHHLTITLPDGKTARGKVVYLQPKAQRGRKQTATVHIVTSDWLALHGYEAVYSTPEQTISGRYTPRGYSVAEGQWLLMGTFDVTPEFAHLS